MSEEVIWYADKYDAENIREDFRGETAEEAAAAYFLCHPKAFRCVAYQFVETALGSFCNEEVEFERDHKTGALTRIEYYQDGDFLAEMGRAAQMLGYPQTPKGMSPDEIEYIYPEVPEGYGIPRVFRSYAIKANPKKE